MGCAKRETFRRALKAGSPVAKRHAWRRVPASHHEDKRIGGSTLKEWQALVRFVQAEDKIKDASVLFTNELLDAVNKFDRKAIAEQAKRLTL